jgi:Flp pilus assembly pilin Flp
MAGTGAPGDRRYIVFQVGRGASMAELYTRLMAWLEEERGQTMAEYAVVLAVITVIIVASLTALAGGISNALDAVTAILP